MFHVLVFGFASCVVGCAAETSRNNAAVISCTPDAATDARLDSGAGASDGAAADGGATQFGNAPDGSVPGAALDSGSFPGDSSMGDETCNLGSASSFATNQSLDLFGDITFFDGGKKLPKGRYRVKYEDGCMQYMIGEDWAVHAQADKFNFWLVGETTADKLLVPPGTTGYRVGSGGYATFQECVEVNSKLPPTEFEFAGGKLGIWLQDDPYADNLAGENGRNPKWSLTLLGSCQLLE